MADVANKYPENIAGKCTTWTASALTATSAAEDYAPDNYKRNDDGGYSYVYKQPSNPEEEARCKEAKEELPRGSRQRQRRVVLPKILRRTPQEIFLWGFFICCLSGQVSG